MDDPGRIVEGLWAALKPWAESLGLLAVAAVAGILAVTVVRLAVRYTVRRRDPELAASLRQHLGSVFAWVLPLLAVYLALPFAADVPERAAVRKAFLALLIVGVALALARAIRVLEEALKRRLQMESEDNLRAREFHTRFRILRQVIVLLIWIIAGSAVLMQFDGFRQFGKGLLASAGVASIVLGFAAQRTLGNLIAGFQIALTQPIRLDDVVVVENEWGRVEEITLTYVVVRIWDERRLILPISYFLEKPFTNWTRRTAEILGTVTLHVDYVAPLDAIRTELARIAGNHADWDGRVCELVVLEAGGANIELRALVSAQDSGRAWRLRCAVREGLVDFLQREHPDALPGVRTRSASGHGSEAGEVAADATDAGDEAT